jgi:hypothetical protein
MTKKLRHALFCALALSLAGGAALAQDMKDMKAMSMSAKPSEPTIKVIAENDKLQVVDIVDKPGDVSPPSVRAGRVSHWLTPARLQRTFADGTKDVIVHKSGETTLNTEKRPYSVKNIGTTSVHLIQVVVK